MGYIEQNLLSGEEIQYKAKIHWVIFMKPILIILIPFVILALARGSENMKLFATITFLPAALFFLTTLISAILYYISTELVITNNRTVAKFGFIKRNTAELNNKNIESYYVEQSILGRILNFGTIIIKGTGGGLAPIRMVTDPLAFRKTAMEISESRD